MTPINNNTFLSHQPPPPSGLPKGKIPIKIPGTFFPPPFPFQFPLNQPFFQNFSNTVQNHPTARFPLSQPFIPSAQPFIPSAQPFIPSVRLPLTEKRPKGTPNADQTQFKTEQLYKKTQQKTKQPLIEKKESEHPQPAIDKTVKTNDTSLPTPKKSGINKNTQTETFFYGKDQYFKLKKTADVAQSYFDFLLSLTKDYPDISLLIQGIPTPNQPDSPYPSQKKFHHLYSRWRVFLHYQTINISKKPSNPLLLQKNQEFVDKMNSGFHVDPDPDPEEIDFENLISVTPEEKQSIYRWRQILIGFNAPEFKQKINTILGIADSESPKKLNIEFTEESIEQGVCRTTSPIPLVSAKANPADFGLN